LPLIIGILFFVSSPSLVAGKVITSADRIEARGINFTWSDVRKKTLDREWRGASLGSGFVNSPRFVGLVVNSNREIAGVVSIENVLATFFPESADRRISGFAN